MLKWILGGVAVLTVVLAGTCWYGYKKVTEGGDTTEVAIAGTQERVFASLVNPDSMVLWMSPGTTVAPLGRDIAVGDTLRIEGRIGDNAGSRQDMVWIVREVSSPTRIVMDMADDSTGQAIFVRRDELGTRNDSTILTTSFTSPMMDTVATTARDSSRFASGVVSGVQKLMVSGARLAAEIELRRLKARVEGTPMP